MATIPCLKAENRCFPCAGDSSNPFANLSIEPFDTNIFQCVYFGSVVNVIPNAWQRDTCVGFDESPISQTDACDRAVRRSKECLPEPPIPPKDPPPPDPPDPPNPPPPPSANYTFCNDAVSCQSGSNCYTLPECTVFGNSKADANAIAQSLCDTRVNDPALTAPCSGGGGGGGGGGGSPGQIVTYEKAWNEPGRGEFQEGVPCPWPDDFATTWLDTDGFLCICDGSQDPYQWPFGEGDPTSLNTSVIQSGNTLDAQLYSYVLPDTGTKQNDSSEERLYLRHRIDGGVAGKHVVLQGHWEFPGGSWIEGTFDGDLNDWIFDTKESKMSIAYLDDPCAVYSFSEHSAQIDLEQALPASGDFTFEFDVAPGQTKYACFWIESETHAFGPSTLHLVTTIT